MYQIHCRYTKRRKLKGFFLLFEFNSRQFLYAVLTFLQDEISLPKVYEREFIKNEKKDRLFNDFKCKIAVFPPRFFILRQKDSTKVRIGKKKR